MVAILFLKKKKKKKKKKIFWGNGGHFIFQKKIKNRLSLWVIPSFPKRLDRSVFEH